jgi:methionyl aminopeptidase
LLVKVGVTTKYLEREACNFIKKRGGYPAFLGYMGFPASVCISLNEQVVHGIPNNNRILKEGDLVKIDLGVLLDGFYGDAAVTIPVGEVSPTAKRLMDVTKQALFKGIGQARIGKRVSDISYAIQSYVESFGFSVVREFVGHGIGRNIHEEPQVPNYVGKGRDPRLKEGMVICLEPMVNEGTYHVKILNDGWTAVTKDGKLSAHYEHMIVIKEDGPEILTLWDFD